jgi:hypothetical protein
VTPLTGYDKGGFLLLRHTSITAITNIGKLTIYASESPQYELIKRKRDPEIKNNIALTM